MKIKMTEKSGFMMYYLTGLGWKVDIEDPRMLKAVRKHIKRIQRRRMFGDIPNHRYYVCVVTKFFGLSHTYTLV